MSSELEKCAVLLLRNRSLADGQLLVENTLEDRSSAHFGCEAHFDRSVCWQEADYGQVVERECPFAYCQSVDGCDRIKQTYLAHRQCGVNGEWDSPNYNQCIAVVDDFRHCIVGYCHSCPDLTRDMVISVTLTLSIISVALLVVAIVLFSVFDSIQCRRLAIHKNLALAFVFRFSVLAVWTVVQSSNLFEDCTSFLPTPIKTYDWLCKTILWFLIYFQVASVMWMLIEGVYLYSRFTVFAMRQSDMPYIMYLLAGWGVPLVVVMSWTVVHEMNEREKPDAFCWLPYATGNHLWILAGTMGFALVLNLMFLLAIVVILVKKLRNENSAESKKIWRTIKATMLLVPLLGVSNIPLFYEPDVRNGAYMLGSAILQHSQGIFIAVLYCFLNSEIQNAVRRQFSKIPFNLFTKHRGEHFETERTYVPEGRGKHSGKHGKLGVPMGQLNASGGGRERPDGATHTSTSLAGGDTTANNHCTMRITDQPLITVESPSCTSPEITSSIKTIDRVEDTNDVAKH